MRLLLDEEELIAAKPYFKQFNVGWGKAFAGKPQKVIKVYKLTKKGLKYTKQFAEGTSVAELFGGYIGEKFIDKVTARPSRYILKHHKRAARYATKDRSRKNGLGGRSWYVQPTREQMVIVFHDANRAGPHLDVHLGRVSLIYRVKPDLYSQLKFNRDGYLTIDSRAKLIEHIRSEINNNSRVPQNLDHSIANARMSWVNGGTDGTDYGAGRTRQVVAEAEVDIYKAHEGGAMEMYAPLLNAHRSLYLYQIYPGTDKKAPICIWGVKGRNPPPLEDRLHLKMTHPENLAKLEVKADMRTSTAKYDGASCYIVATSKGTTIWSPRQSKLTGEQIEYTMKINGLASMTTDETVIGMGEILFKEKGKYLSAAEIGGILNSNMVIPRNLQPEVRLYRIDKVGRNKTIDLEFWENRKLAEELASKSPKILKLAELMQPAEAKKRGFEGVVVVPEGGSITQGHKVKWWTDPHDWVIDRVAFEPGAKGRIAGVVWCTSTQSGKRFKLGPGQMGNQALCEDMMDFPEKYEGVVLKVESRHGHEGRAAKVKEIHPDKGLAPF